MVGMNRKASRDGIFRELTEKAADLWGPERAAAIRTVLEQMSNNIWLVAQNPPDSDEEPAFFL